MTQSRLRTYFRVHAPGICAIAPALALLLFAAPVLAAPVLSCGKGAVTCVEVVPSQAQEIQPVTFGQPFRQGDVPSGAGLSAVDGNGADLPLQMDAVATWPDRSVRFAVFSTQIAGAKPGEPRLVNLLHGMPRPVEAAAPKRFDLKVAVTLYARQVSIVKFGNRDGHTPGIPFKQGEEIGLHVGGENFTLRIVSGMTDGDYVSYQNIAKAFADIINRQSKEIRASWNGAEAGFEEDLWLTTATTKSGFSVTVSYHGQAKIAVLPYRKAQPPGEWLASLSREDGKLWLSGPVAVERDIGLPLISAATGKPHPLLAVRVHLRRYPGAGAVRADVVLENDWSYVPQPGNLTYDVNILRDGQTVLARKGLTHFHHARWHSVIWSDGFGEPIVRYNIPYFLDSGAVPHYDASIRISERALDFDAALMAKADNGPMGTSTVTPYMPTTGMRADIGPLPQWTAQYLLSMDRRARAMMLANADAGASMPLHYRDEATGLPVSLDRHPALIMQFGTPTPPDAFPKVEDRVNPWTLDSAHLPSLPYVPYLVTGDLFYLEEVMYFANWVMGSIDPGYRAMDKGLLWANQVRATAWSLRSLGQAAIILPDAHPLKGYFNSRLRNNLAYYLGRFVRNPSANVSPLGILENVDQNGLIGPWQYDFFFLSVADLARAKVPQAEELARWMARFVVGRWSQEAEAQGYCHRMAPAYYVKFRDASGKPFSDWGDLFRANWPEAKSCPSVWVEGSGEGAPDGYIANSYAALGAAAALGIPGAREAQARIARESYTMLNAFQQNPTFAIVP